MTLDAVFTGRFNKHYYIFNYVKFGKCFNIVRAELSKGWSVEIGKGCFCYWMDEKGRRNRYGNIHGSLWKTSKMLACLNYLNFQSTCRPHNNVTNTKGSHFIGIKSENEPIKSSKRHCHFIVIGWQTSTDFFSAWKTILTAI